MYCEYHNDGIIMRETFQIQSMKGCVWQIRGEVLAVAGSHHVNLREWWWEAGGGAGQIVGSSVYHLE